MITHLNTRPLKGFPILTAAYFLLSLKFLLYVWHHTVNGPFCDDILTILRPINSLEKHGLLSFIHELALPHNEHSVSSLKLISAVYYRVFSEVNFQWLCILGSLSLILIPVVLSEKNYMLLCMLGLLFLTPRVNGSSLWAMAAITNFSVILFFALSLKTLEFHNIKYSISLPLLFLCVLTQGNGLIFGTLICLYCTHRNGITKSIPFYAVFFLAVYIYFNNWIPNADPRRANYSYINNASEMVAYFFGVLGSISPNPALATIIGATSFMVYFLIKKYEKKIDLYDVMIVGLLLSAAMITPNRVFLGPDTSVASRYSILSLTLIGSILCKITLHNKKPSKKFVKPLTFFSLIAFYSWSWLNLSDKELTSYFVGKELATSEGTDFLINITCGHDATQLKSIVLDSLSLGIYRRQ